MLCGSFNVMHMVKQQDCCCFNYAIIIVYHTHCYTFAVMLREGNCMCSDYTPAAEMGSITSFRHLQRCGFNEGLSSLLYKHKSCFYYLKFCP